MNHNPHPFLFIPGIWLGEGKITFKGSPEILKFYTKWEITLESPTIVKALQTIQIQGIEDKTHNSYIFEETGRQTFLVKLENALMGLTEGKGLYDERIIAWEIKNEHFIAGFENFERQKNGDYFHHAEYGGEDKFGSTIEGLIWKKTPPHLI